MIATWADAWFEEGTRLLYIVPQAAVDSILPLRIAPRPSQIVRVFVGRLDLMSGEMERDIRQALFTSDRAALISVRPAASSIRRYAGCVGLARFNYPMATAADWLTSPR